MRTIRTPLTASQPFYLEQVKAHGRIDGSDDDATVDLMAHTAAADIEAQADLALLAQSITVEVEAWGCAVILPVGPALTSPDNPPTVTVIDAEGVETPLLTGWWMYGSMRPVLRFSTSPVGALLRITYTAGYGENTADVPVDLQLAIHDHAARLYDLRGAEDGPPGLSTAAARIVARYKRVRA
jgi:uncharacterized phiE125 gp8 family phage protein